MQEALDLPSMNVNIDIRTVSKNDLGHIVRLMQDFAEYEKLSHYCKISEELLFEAMFGNDSFVEGLIAFEDDLPFAYAMFYPHFASFRGQCGYYLEDIFISGGYRGMGIGEVMIKEIAKLAAGRGFERIDFQVLEWNTPAVKFYEKIGAVRDDEERHFKFTDEAFKQLLT